ncbi:F-box protein PP2-A15-like protein [Drosera capensis]
MGSTISNLSDSGGGESAANRPGLGDIPEACIASVFLYLTPPEICNLAPLNRAFRGAASSDVVWETKLPRNYQELVGLLLPPEKYGGLSKKDVFAVLSRPIKFDDGNKKDVLGILSRPIKFDDRNEEVWVDRWTGRVCMSISAKGMAITGIDDRRYWNWIPTDESRVLRPEISASLLSFLIIDLGTPLFQVVAYLLQIWWFEVDGIVRFPLPPDTYILSFRLHLGKFSKRLGRRVSHFEHTHGWEIKPVKFELTTSDGQQVTTEYFLDDKEHDDTIGNLKRGCWIDYSVGEFIVTDSEPATEVHFSMKQIDCTHSKGGLCVDSVSIVPRCVRERRRRSVSFKQA